MERQENGERGTQCSLPSSSSSAPLLSSPSLRSAFSRAYPQNARELRLTISLTILYTSAAEQWRTTTKNSGNRGTALLLLGVAPACPSIHIGLQRLTGAKETAREGGRERERHRVRGRERCVQVCENRNNQTTSCVRAHRPKLTRNLHTRKTNWE